MTRVDRLLIAAQRPLAGILLLAGALALIGCSSRSKLVAERKALAEEAEAIEARHKALDDEIAKWSDAVGAWASRNAPDVDPARLVLSLSSRSYFLHEAHGPGTTAADTDPEYARLEDQMKDIQARRRQIETDWTNLLARDRASLEHANLKGVEHQVTFDYGFGDSTIPVPGVAARQACCSLTTTVPGQTGCKLLTEYCVKPSTAGGKWRRVCWYICDPKVISTADASSGAAQAVARGF